MTYLEDRYTRGTRRRMVLHRLAVAAFVVLAAATAVLVFLALTR